MPDHNEYERRVNRVIAYLRENLDRPVNLDELADVACFSKFHFHRIFSLVSGETVKECTNRLRVEKAARLLRFTRRPVTYIALDCGFSSSTPRWSTPSGWTGWSRPSRRSSGGPRPRESSRTASCSA